MGENKAFIQIDGIPIIKRIHALFGGLFDEILIVTNQKGLYKALDAKIYKDIFTGAGVAGGLYTGLFFSSRPYSFCVAADMPFLSKAVIEYLISCMDDYDVIVPRTNDGLQPLHAIYSKNCVDALKRVIDEKKRRIIDIFPLVRTKVVDEVEFLSLDPNRKSFINVNTPEELDRVRQGRLGV